MWTDFSFVFKVTLSFIFRDVFCAGRVVEEDLRRTMKACGGSIQTSVNNLTDDDLGCCENFEEQQIGGERWARDNIDNLIWMCAYKSISHSDDACV